MARAVYLLLSFGILFEISVAGLIMSLTKPDGSPDIHSIINHVVLLEQTVSDYQTKTIQLESALHDATVELQATKKELQDQRVNFTAQIASLTKDIETRTEDVAFHAYLTYETDIAINGTMKYDGVRYNAGSGYSATTGRFTAPVSGTYVFTVHSHIYLNSTSQLVGFFMTKSGTPIATVVLYTADYLDEMAGSATTITYVAKDEQVWVTADNAVHVFSNDYQQCMFAGSLLSPH